MKLKNRKQIDNPEKRMENVKKYVDQASVMTHYSEIFKFALISSGVEILIIIFCFSLYFKATNLVTFRFNVLRRPRLMGTNFSVSKLLCKKAFACTKLFPVTTIC